MSESDSQLREKLPRDLPSWRRPPGYEESFEPCEAIWEALRPFFQEHGYTLWDHAWLCVTRAPSTDACSSGFMYSMPHREYGDQPGSAAAILEYDYKNALTRAARASDGRDVVIRVLAIGEEGEDHVELLGMVARGVYSLLSINHSLPLLELIELDDITFGVFPKAGWSLDSAYNFWAKTSVGDILNMLTQCLEALVFLHHLGVAHRDVLKDNFLAQWLPESLTMAHIPPVPPRIYLNDFEVAVYLPPDLPAEERLCTGPPVGGSIPDRYGRPLPSEVTTGKPYDPFKLDVWQLGTTFSDFKSTISEVDAILVSLTDPDPTTRPTAYDALKALMDTLATIPPQQLRIPPLTEPLQYYNSSGSG